jgi:hypothetical protein
VRDARHGSQMNEPFIINVAAAALALPMQGSTRRMARRRGPWGPPASPLLDLLDRDHPLERVRRSAGTVRDEALERVAAGLQVEVDDL